MRRVLVLLSLLAVAASPARGQQTLVGMYPAGVGLDSGRQATVAIAVDRRSGIQSLGAYQLQVTWDPAVLRYVRTTPPLNFGVPTVNESAAATGTLTLASALPQGSAGIFAIANITFEMLVSSGSSPVTVVSPELTASSTFAPIPATATSGTICTTAGLFGDVNRDGSILSNDALLVVTAAVGLPISPYVLTGADVDADGDADTRDALIILSAAVGLPTTGFRVGQPQGAPCAGAPADSMAVFPVVLAVAAGESVQLTATLYDSTGIVTSGVGVVWTTDAAGVATVDSGGRVTALSDGVANIKAQAIGATSRDIPVTVAPRHIWYVDATDAAAHTVRLGSFNYPFAEIQAALDAAAPNDTIVVARAATIYGAITITKPVTILGDSTASGMPTVHNSTGPAIVVNAAGTVTLRHLSMTESNAGLDARGDSLIVQFVTADALRGLAFRAQAMAWASFRDISVSGAVLAGVLADSTVTVLIQDARVHVIAQRNDSAAGIAILHGDTAIVVGLDVLGVENGSGAVFSKLRRGVLDRFSVRAAGGVNADSVVSMSLANGAIQDARSGDRPLSVHADTVTIDTVVVDGASRGIELSPISRDTVTQPGTMATVTRSAIRNIAGAGGMVVDRFARLTVDQLSVTNVQLDHGIEVRRVPDVQIDGASVTGIGEGVAVRVDPVVAGVRLSMRGGSLRGTGGGLAVDGMGIVILAGVAVDSSAIPPRFCFSCAAGWAVRIAHADSVQLDSLNVHDNAGGGILVDEARAVVGRGSIVARNLGFGGSGGECGELGCQVDGKTLRPGLTHGQYASNFVAGVVFNLVEQTGLAHWTVQDNSNGGMLFYRWAEMQYPFAILDTMSFRGPELLNAAGNFASLGAQLMVRGGSFRVGGRAIQASSLLRFTVAGVTFDSLTGSAEGIVQSTNVREVTLWDDTVSAGAGYAFQIQGGFVDARRNVIRNRPVSYPYVQESAIDLYLVDSAFVYGNRLEFNGIRGIIVYGGAGGLITIDSNVVADDSSFGLQLHRPAIVTRNLFARNSNAIWVDFGGEPSQIHQNNFEGNVFTAVRNESNDLVNATDNWWNAADGPQCAGATTGCISTTGDIAYGLNFGVTFTPFLTARAGGAPIAAPPMRAAGAGKR